LDHAIIFDLAEETISEYCGHKLHFACYRQSEKTAGDK